MSSILRNRTRKDDPGTPIVQHSQFLGHLGLHRLADRDHVWKLKAEKRGAHHLFVIRRRRINEAQGGERRRAGDGATLNADRQLFLPHE